MTHVTQLHDTPAFDRDAYLNRGMLRLLTCGSVDDGKSTLIGRLLHDSRSIYEDQLAAVRGASERRGDTEVNLALVTDGLRAEREQGITIDVAYRYFSTPRRKFIIADTPGHVQYTRNMVTGASTADLAIVLIDARTGVVEQTRRHAFIASLLRIPNVVVAVNKMDLVDHARARFEEIQHDFESFAAGLDFRGVSFIPMSALRGDNVVDRSAHMPWYDGLPLLDHIEHLPLDVDAQGPGLRFSTQWIIRPHAEAWHDYRGYAGTVDAGVVRRGDEVLVSPAGHRSRVRSIHIGEREIESAVSGQAVAIQLEDDIDVSRGDLLCDPLCPPREGRELDATVVWMSERPLELGRKYIVKHLSRELRAVARGLHYRLDTSDLSRDPAATQLALNEIGKVQIEQPTTLWGSTFFGGYKIGLGDLPTWDGDLKSQTDGEFSGGVRIPLLAGRRIEKRRVAVWQARLSAAQADPIILQKRLEATRKAALLYWKWVASGQKLGIAERNLALAENRQEAVREAVDAGELPRISLTENQRLVVERQSLMVDATRNLQAAAIALSLYWRDAKGNPVVLGVESLPRQLPRPEDPDLTMRADDEQLALQQRPEVRALEIDLLRLGLDLEQAQNDLLPKFDIGVEASQDIGDDVTDPDDKGPFEFDAFAKFELPIQRRAARGKARTLEAKAAKVERELQFVRDLIVADVRDIASALRQTWLRLEQVRENARLAGELEAAERLRLREGQSDLFRVNLRELQTAKAASMLVDVLAEYFQSLAEYRASLGLPYTEVLRPDVAIDVPER